MSDIERDELVARLGEPGLVLIDVRTEAEYAGNAGAACDPRQGHIPGARHVDLRELFDAPGPVAVQRLLGAEPGVEVIAYCHSGSRSAHAVAVLREAGYRARNYVGSWHEWSSDPSLPAETGSG